MSASVSDPGSEPKHMPQPKPRPFAFRASSAPVPYYEAVAEMEARVAAIQAGEAVELLWFLEHPPLYTAGTSADKADLIDPDRFPVFKSGRGGQYTYHGPGQRVAYVMFDLGRALFHKGNRVVVICQPGGIAPFDHDKCQFLRRLRLLNSGSICPRRAGKCKPRPPAANIRAMGRISVNLLFTSRGG